MAKTKTPTVKLGLYIADKRDGEWYHIRARVVTLGLNEWEQHAIARGEEISQSKSSNAIRNASSDLLNGLYLNNIEFSCQGDTSSNPQRLYGFEVKYRDVYGVTRVEAEHMAKTLRIIETRLEKLNTKFGHPSTFGQFLARGAQAIKADTFIRLMPNRPNNRGWSYDDSEHQFLSVKNGIYVVDQMASDWINEGQKDEVSA